jgi:hypothetical protein
LIKVENDAKEIQDILFEVRRVDNPELEPLDPIIPDYINEIIPCAVIGYFLHYEQIVFFKVDLLEVNIPESSSGNINPARLQIIHNAHY